MVGLTGLGHPDRHEVGVDHPEHAGVTRPVEQPGVAPAPPGDQAGCNQLAGQGDGGRVGRVGIAPSVTDHHDVRGPRGRHGRWIGAEGAWPSGCIPRGRTSTAWCGQLAPKRAFRDRSRRASPGGVGAEEVGGVVACVRPLRPRPTTLPSRSTSNSSDRDRERRPVAGGRRHQGAGEGGSRTTGRSRSKNSVAVSRSPMVTRSRPVAVAGGRQGWASRPASEVVVRSWRGSRPRGQVGWARPSRWRRSGRARRRSPVPRFRPGRPATAWRRRRRPAPWPAPR